MNTRRLLATILLIGVSVLFIAYLKQRNSYGISLSDPSAEYSIGELGPHYDLVIKKDDNTRGLMIGTASISLEQFLNKKVKVEGKIDTRTGEMLCRPGYEAECSEVSAVVVDITSIELTE